MYNITMNTRTTAGIRIGTYSPVGGRCRTLRSCYCRPPREIKHCCRCPHLQPPLCPLSMIPAFSWYQAPRLPVISHLDPDPIIFGYENRCYDAVPDEPTPSATACIIISASSEVTAPSRFTSALGSIPMLPTAICKTSTASAVVSKSS